METVQFMRISKGIHSDETKVHLKRGALGSKRTRNKHFTNRLHLHLSEMIPGCQAHSERFCSVTSAAKPLPNNRRNRNRRNNRLNILIAPFTLIIHPSKTLPRTHFQ